MTTSQQQAYAAVDDYAATQYAQGKADGIVSVSSILPSQVFPSESVPVVKFSSLYKTGDSSLMDTVNRLTSPSSLLMDRPGVFEFHDFAQATDKTNYFGYGLYHSNLRELIGDFQDHNAVTLRMKTRTSKVSAPTTGTNNYSLIRVGRLGNVTVEGTPQNHTYNGVVFFQGSTDLGGNIEVNGISGSANFPPGETFGVNLLQCKGTAGSPVTLADVEVSGIRRSDGALVGASPIGWNSCSFVNTKNLNCHDSLTGMPTFWSSQNCQTLNLRSARNGSGTGPLSGCGINHEESSAITHTNPTLLIDHGGMSYQHIQVASAHFDCAVQVVNPIFDHPAYVGSDALTIMIPSHYGKGEKVTGNSIVVVDAEGALVPTKVYR